MRVWHCRGEFVEGIGVVGVIARRCGGDERKHVGAWACARMCARYAVGGCMGAHSAGTRFSTGAWSQRSLELPERFAGSRVVPVWCHVCVLSRCFRFRSAVRCVHGWRSGGAGSGVTVSGRGGVERARAARAGRDSRSERCGMCAIFARPCGARTYVNTIHYGCTVHTRGRARRGRWARTGYRRDRGWMELLDRW